MPRPDHPRPLGGGRGVSSRVSAGHRKARTGRFVTAEEEPHDIYSVILLSQDFTQQELFAVKDEADWEEWADFFVERDAGKKVSCDAGSS